MSRRTLIGIVFVLHGLAHSGLGLWAAARGPAWYVVPLWWLAEVGFIAAGFGLLGIPWCRRVWEPIAVVAALSSILLLQWFGSVTLALGMLVDAIILVLGLRWGESALLPAALARRGAGAAPVEHPSRHRVLVLTGTVFVLYVAAVIPARAWYLRWGTTAADRLATLPGGELSPSTTYRVDRAVTIRMPADSVWPSLVQLGRDRVGSDSVEQIVPHRALVLEGRGAFVLIPRDSVTTTLYVRTRGERPPTLRNSMLAPADLLLLEPIHFGVERRMLLGIKARAERRRQS